jgi:hypothetical protein
MGGNLIPPWLQQLLETLNPTLTGAPPAPIYGAPPEPAVDSQTGLPQILIDLLNAAAGVRPNAVSEPGVIPLPVGGGAGPAPVGGQTVDPYAINSVVPPEMLGGAASPTGYLDLIERAIANSADPSNPDFSQFEAPQGSLAFDLMGETATGDGSGGSGGGGSEDSGFGGGGGGGGGGDGISSSLSGLPPTMPAVPAMDDFATIAGLGKAPKGGIWNMPPELQAMLARNPAMLQAWLAWMRKQGLQSMPLMGQHGFESDWLVPEGFTYDPTSFGEFLGGLEPTDSLKFQTIASHVFGGSEATPLPTVSPPPALPPTLSPTPEEEIPEPEVVTGG